MGAEAFAMAWYASWLLTQSAEAFLRAVESEGIAICDGEETLFNRRRQTHVMREMCEL
jgi:hypothetical protein